jgi:23S rRNA (uracil1939-C5)-methyltransferase
VSGPAAGVLLEILDLDHEGRGVGRLAGKAVFVAGALPGEQVRVGRLRRHARHDEATLLEVIAASPARVSAPCPAFGRCGGCALQHLESAAQLAAKSHELRAQLARIGKVKPLDELPPLAGSALGYRRRARLGVRYLAREQRAIVGFRSRDSSRLAALEACPVLAAPAAGLPGPLAALLTSLSIAARVTEVEVAVTAEVTSLVLRVLDAPSSADRDRLRAFAAAHAVEFWLRAGAAASAEPLDPPGTPLRYRLPAFDLTLEFGPLDFVQVNGELNERLVERAVALLAAAPGDAVLDLFAGLGNFTLALARGAAAVLGVDVDAALLGRGRDNASRNGIGNARFALADLDADLRREPWAGQRFQRVLLDPPRAGALGVLPLIGRLRPRRVVYISCHPGTLARDAGLLVHQHGFTLVAAGVIDMFPHTAHLESIALFEPAR